MPASSSSTSPQFLESPPSCKDPELHHYQTMFLSSWNNTSAPASSSTLVPLKRFLHIENAIAANTISPISSASSEPLYRCDICDVTATTEEQLNTHMQGGKHKRRVLISETDSKLKLLNDDVLQYLDVGKWKCKACNLEMCCLSIETHLKGDKHRKKLKVWLASQSAPSPSPAVRDISVLRRQSSNNPPPVHSHMPPQQRARPPCTSHPQSHPQEKRNPTNLATVFLANTNNNNHSIRNGASSVAQVQQSGRAGLNANAKEFLPSAPTGGRTDRSKLPPTIIVGGNETQELLSPTADLVPNSSASTPITITPATGSAPPRNNADMHSLPAPADKKLPIKPSTVLTMSPTFITDILPKKDGTYENGSRLKTAQEVPSAKQISKPFAPFGLGASCPSLPPRLPSPVPRVDNPPTAPPRSHYPQPEPSMAQTHSDSGVAAHAPAPWNAVPATSTATPAAFPVLPHTQEPPKNMLVDDAHMTQLPSNGGTVNQRAPLPAPASTRALSVELGTGYPSNVNAANRRPLLSVPTHEAPSAGQYGQTRAAYDNRVDTFQQERKESGPPPLKKKKPSDSPLQHAPSAAPSTGLPPVSGLPASSSGVMPATPTENPPEAGAKAETFECKVCSVVCNGKGSLKEHLNSKNHQKKMETANVVEQIPNASEGGGQNRYCGLCKKNICGEKNYMEHIKGKAHGKKLTQRVEEDKRRAEAAAAAAAEAGLVQGDAPVNTTTASTSGS